MSKVIIKTTGEIIDISPSTSVTALSNARKQVLMEIKELEAAAKEIDEILEPHVLTALENGEKTFCDYWTVQNGARRFSKTLFEEEADIKTIAQYKKAKGIVTDIEEQYKVVSKPFLKFPRL